MDLQLIGLSLCALLLIALLWREYRRPNRARRLWRMLASALAVAALALLFIPLSVTRTTRSGGEAVWLTEGYAKDSLAKLSKLPRFTTDPALAAAPGVHYLPAAADLLQKGIKKVHLLGYGPAPGELESTPGLDIQFHPSAVSEGFTAASWPRMIRAGQELNVQGSYTPKRGKIKLVLQGLGTTLDSATVSPDSPAFSLAAVPKQSGRSLFRLIALSGRDTLSVNPVPVIIEEEQKPSVLLLASAPGFENRFLKDWLGRQGYPVAVRSRSSKDRSVTGFENLDRPDILTLTDRTLSRFDLVVLDQDELSLLKPAELGALQRQVQGGMGVLLRADSSARRGGFSYNTRRIAAKSFGLNLAGKAALTALPVEEAVTLAPQPGTQIIAFANKTYPVASVRLSGAGRTGLTTLQSTFQWLLAGQEKDYVAFWSELIGRTARAGRSVRQWQVSPVFAAPGEQLSLSFPSGKGAPPGLSANGASLAPAQHPLNPGLWSATFWAQQSGWQELKGDGESSAFYVFSPGEWPGMRATERIAATQAFLKDRATEGNATTPDTETVKEPVSQVWWFLLFLLSAGYLWVERKVS